MASSNNASSEVDAIIEDVKILIAKAYTLIYKAEYSSLYKIAIDTTKNTDAAKNILDDSFDAILESGLTLSDDVKNSLKHKVEESCRKHNEEVEANREFHILHSQNVHYDNSYNDEAIKAAIEEFHKLPPKRKRIFFETLLPGLTPRKVAENNNMAPATVLKMNWKTRQILKKKLNSKFR